MHFRLLPEVEIIKFGISAIGLVEMVSCSLVSTRIHTNSYAFAYFNQPVMSLPRLVFYLIGKHLISFMI